MEAILSAGSAGICLGLGEVHTQTPAALTTQCRKLGVVLLEMSHGVPFLAINDVLAAARVTAEASGNARDGALVIALIEELRGGGTVSELLGIAERTLGGILIYDVENEHYEAGPTRDKKIYETTVEEHLGEAETIRWFHSGAQTSAPVLAQVGRILQIARRERDLIDEDRRRRVGQLIALIADGLAHVSSLFPSLEEVGLDRSLLRVSAWPAGTGHLLRERMSDSLVADTAETTFVISSGHTDILEIATELGLVCGYGSRVGRTDLGRGLLESLATLQLARNRGAVTGPESLTTLESLLEQQPPTRLMPFADQLIRPLLSSDIRGGEQLLSTLRSFFAGGGSLQGTAQDQYLHANSVRHRLHRIAELVGRNPLDHRDQADFRIAIWAFDRLPASDDSQTFRPRLGA